MAAAHVVIAGAGAMGCLFGGLLAEGRLEVTLLVRRQAHVDAIVGNGLRIVGEGGDRRVSLKATTSVAEIAPADIVLFQCKAHDTPTVAAAVAPLFIEARGAEGRETVAISFQNGLGNEAAIAAVLGEDVVLGGLTAQGATLEAPGIVRNYATLPSLIGERAGGLSPRAERIAALLSAHGLPVTASGDIMREKWRKLLLNVALSATSGITGLSIGEVLAIPALAATAHRAMDEAAAVAAATGVTLPENQRYGLFETIAGSGAARNKTSMRRDIEAERPSELDAIYGGVIRLAEAHGVAVPTLRTLAALIGGIESRYL
jgi:2-dehydropantoate 2-reductase